MEQSIVINSEGFSNSINSFEIDVKKVEEKLNNITNIMKEIDGQNETWKSKVGTKVHEKYTEIEKKFEEINKELNNYQTFLKTTLEDYKREENKLEKSIEDNSANLDVNE